MYKFPNLRSVVAAIGLLAALSAHAAAPSGKAIDGVGRAATGKEIAAWDIDVRPDFQGLPKGAGSVAAGQAVWESRCASCHGVFGESNEVFSPLVGGVTKEDIKSGHVANLKRLDYPGRTTLMKVATVSTLWDYINRAMPWNAPKSLKVDEVYAVLAYLLNMGGILPDDYVMSDKNIAEVQNRMPNRNGMTMQHAMWPTTELGGTSKADTQNTACMSNCKAEAKVVSELPAHARNAQGNLAEQNRLFGAQRGVDTTKPPISVMLSSAAAAGATTPSTPASAPKVESPNAAVAKAATAIMQKNNCLACHGMTSKVVGPGFNEIAKKYSGQTDYLAGKIKSGSSGVWGAIPMPAQTLNDADLKAVATWLAAGMPK